MKQLTMIFYVKISVTRDRMIIFCIFRVILEIKKHCSQFRYAKVKHKAEHETT